MGTRGRPSLASLSVVTPFHTAKRPEPPEELTPEQAEEWEALVNRMPPDWFPRETHGLLVQYCRQVVVARRAAELIAIAEAADAFDQKEWLKLLQVQDKATSLMAALATKMRITQNATYDKSKKKANPGKPLHQVD